jgi:hypothetical protein
MAAEHLATFPLYPCHPLEALTYLLWTLLPCPGGPEPFVPDDTLVREREQIENRGSKGRRLRN